MFRLSITFLFLIQPLFLKATENESLLLLTAPQYIEEKSTSYNEFEYVRDLVNFYLELPPEQRDDFLETNQLIKDTFERLIPFVQLDWKRKGKHQLPNSNSTITIPAEYCLVMGEDAFKLMKHKEDNWEENLEAYVYDTATLQEVVLFIYHDEGYVSLDDWDEIDPKDLLESISANTEEDNKVRRKNGYSDLKVVGWLQEPKLNRDTNTVYWAIEASSDDHHFVNSTALRLGRNGYENITWVTSLSSYVPFDGHLAVMLNAHKFDAGYAYMDHESGDKMAKYGIAALVAGSAGAKIMKAGGFLLFFKKFWTLLIAGVGAMFYKLKNWFLKRKAS